MVVALLFKFFSSSEFLAIVQDLPLIVVQFFGGDFLGMGYNLPDESMPLPTSNIFKSSFLMGVLSLLFLMSLIVSIQMRRLRYFYYSIYLVLAIVFFFNHYHFLFQDFFLIKYQDVPFWVLFEQILISLAFAFYLLYLKQEVSSHVKLGGFLREVWSSYIALLFVSSFGTAFLFFVWSDVEMGMQFKLVFRWMSYIIVPLMVFLIYRIENDLVKYVSSGVVLLFLGGTISFAMQMIFLDPYGLVATDVMLLAVIAELVVFTTFVAMRLKGSEFSKQEQQQILIDELKLRDRQGAVLRRNLEIELEQRSTQIELESEKALQAEYKEHMTELELKALRSQMNPHFLFNCLNSLKRLVLEKDHENAQTYIDKFSILLRMILNNSRESVIDLKSEIEGIRLYLELENLRFKKKFDYIIINDPDIVLEQVDLPPMLLQPFVENAIWHGLMHKENGQRKLEIFIKKHDEFIEISIRDNGVGRSLGTAIKRRNARFRSLGGQITSERLHLINSFENENRVSARIVDLYDRSDRPTGTEVILKLAQ